MPNDKRKGTARDRTRAITDRLRRRPAADDVTLTDLATDATGLGARLATALDAGDVRPAVRFPEPLVRAVEVVGRPNVWAIPDSARARAVRASVAPAAGRPPARPVGLAQIVAELLDECATDAGVDALQQTPGVPGSAVMNPVSRAIAHATGGQCWIGDEHRYAVVQRGDALARVELPGRLQALLDSIELRPELYPRVRPAAAA